MNGKIERLLFILAVGAWLIGCACTGAHAGLSLSSSPTKATVNSIWNQLAVWQDSDGAMPMLYMTDESEGMLDYGKLDDGRWVNYTVGTVRRPVPVAYDNTLMWWPQMPAPDGFAGFQPPAEDPVLPGEIYQEPAYSSVQPDPVGMSRLERGGGQLYDCGVDFIDDVVSSVDGQSGVRLADVNRIPAGADLPTPDASGLILVPDANDPSITYTDGWVDATDEQVNFGTVDQPNNVTVKNNPIIILEYSPVALVGVWNDPDRTEADRVQAKLTRARLANVTYTATAADGTTQTKYVWTQYYNVIEIVDPRAAKDKGGIKNVAPRGRLWISCYVPGTHYVFTQRNQLPLPYTVYTVSLAYKDDPYVTINDAIIHFDPARDGDPATAASNDEIGLMGVYSTDQLDASDTDPTNYFNIEDFAPRATRYTVTNGVGKIYFSSPLPPELNKAGQTFYVKVSTNAVDGVWLTPTPGDTDYNYYTRDGTNNLSPDNVIGYCAHGGIIRLGTPLNGGVLDPADMDPDAKTWLTGKKVYPGYRYLSDRSFTIGRSPNLGYVHDVSDLRPAASYCAATTCAIKYDPTKTSIGSGGRFSIGDAIPPAGTYAAKITYSRSTGKPTVWLNGSIPMNYIRGSATSGAEFRVSVSAGLNMSNPKQQPNIDRDLNLPALNNKLLYDPYGYPMYYEPGLVSDGISPATRYLSCVGRTVKNGKIVEYNAGPLGVEVHSSSPPSPMIDYGGAGTLDYLWCYSDGNVPYGLDVDPLSVEPVEEANPSAPDDGSSSTQFVFRVHYWNRDDLDPKPWLPDGADPWGGSRSGVVLYLDLTGTGDYQPHFMKPDYEPDRTYNPSSGSSWYYRVLPHNSFVGGGVGYPWPIQGGVADNRLYSSLGIGVYNYFFACSDDSLTFDDGSLLFTHQGNPTEWGQTLGTYCSTGLDPTTTRSVAGYQEIDRPPHRRYSSTGTAAFDGTLYVDRRNRVPGLFEPKPNYPWLASAHPRVSCELHMPAVDDFGTDYDDYTYGFGRFFGTLFPFRSAVNPQHPGMYQRGDAAALAETSGSYSKDVNVFRIMYKQIDNKPPVSIKLWINNASEKTGNTPAHTYRSYTMQRRADQVNPDYRAGVWYEYKLQSGSADLPPGPHTYYFTAYDGESTARWPVRPDYYSVEVPASNPIGADPGTTSWRDAWVPTMSRASERRNPDYIDNDYVPGPYVNNPPVISNVSVTPGTGKEGSRFIYRATYSDPDGQRPYSATITIETNDRGDTRTFTMLVDPSENLDPTANNSARYKAGVKFVLDTATIKDLALEKGTRRFYVQFTDDWGHQDDLNDLRKGETVRYPAGSGNWISGPVISGNTPPTLSNGTVTSLDGTSNAATLWTFRVNYRDVNNDPPAVIKLFIGQLQTLDSRLPGVGASKVKTVIWDSGHTMAQSDPNDKVYSDGAEFYYQTRLGGPDIGAANKQYYYAFEAYDGVDYATYKSSSQDDKRSNSAGCFILQDAVALDTSGEITHFAIRPKIVKQLTLAAASNQINPDPDNLGDILRVWGVYTNEDLTGTNYYDSGGAVPPDYTGGNIVLSGTVPAGKVWVLVEGDTPIIGPLPVENPAPAGVLPDAEVYINASTTGTPVAITDQKNGYIQDPAEVAPGDTPDRAWLQMEGVGSYEGRPSAEYVAPADPESVASIEGVYWLDDPNPTRRSVNYYEPSKLETPVVRVGSFVLDQNGNPDPTLVQLTNPEEVYKVVGVYDNPDLTGTNYFVGAGYSDNPGLDKYLWQEAWVLGTGQNPGQDPDWAVGPNVIWPTRPDQIASIKGVFATLNIDDAQGNFLAPDDTPYIVEGTVEGGAITIPFEYNDAHVIRRILQISEQDPTTGDPGAIYYTAVDPAGDEYTGDPIIPNGDTPDDGQIVYVSYVPAFDFGAYGEFVATKRLLRLNPAPQPPAQQPKVYIAYYPPGDLDANKRIVLPIAFPDPTKPAYVKIWPKAFNPGDRYAKLTTRLPDIAVCGTRVNDTTVAPTDPAVLPQIGEITGVYVVNDCANFDTTSIDSSLVNYYVGTRNPFKPWETTNAGDTVVNLGRVLPALGANDKIVITYVPKERRLVVLYDDIRFTHQISGLARQVASVRYYNDGTTQTISGTLSQGTTHFTPDRANNKITGNSPDPNTGNPRDIDGGVVGVWETPDRTGTNYFNPRRVQRYDDLDRSAPNTQRPMVRLATPAPVGTIALYAQAYQKGVYFIDRWNRKLRFDASELATPLAPTDKVQVSYFFGTRMPKVLVPNTLPSLSEGKVTPITGSRNTGYVYSVKYTDIDGPNGQMPAYVRVYIDGVPYDMKPAVQGTPVYKSGAVYTYTPTTGLTGGSHTYHFEASDGAAIAWFDKNGGHQTERGLNTYDILDIDGPWVNDPPTLSNGTVSPNLPGGISTRDSVDYTVNLKDLDNDPPYVYDPLTDSMGADVSGSPRLWVDAGINEDAAAPMIGVIVGLESDPLQPAKKRVIVAKLDDGYGNLTDPNWTTDQFAGKLMQISNGDKWSDVYPSPYLRVYLIQSNTSNKLVIAADNLENDQLLVPPDPATGSARYVQFRINGLLMSKVDPSQQNYTTGVDYKITVPGLAVGAHKYHFTARTRETKPLWLLNMASYTNKAPYSAVVKFPSLGDATGPTVITPTDPNNSAPVLSKSGSSTLYRGPRSQYGTPTSLNRVIPSSYTGMISVLGVYRNANWDAHLPEAQRVDYLDKTALPNPPATGDPIKLSPSLPAAPDTEDLIQHGSVVNLVTVTPDVPSAIGSVTAVYVSSDPTLTTAYAVNPFTTGDTTITLPSALPSGTTDVYIKYKPATATQSGTADATGDNIIPAFPDRIAYVVSVTVPAGGSNLADTAAWSPGASTIPLLGSLAPGTAVNIRYVPWPPVYIKHFIAEPGTAPVTTPVTHGIFTAGEPLTFTVLYKDADGDPPTYHDGVQGYVKVVFNDSGRTAQLLPSSSSTDYKTGVPFSVTLTDVPEGTHPYHFEASDGLVTTPSRYPMDPGGTGANDEKVKVNYKPALRNGAVDKTAGAAVFTFTVTYSDQDGVGPTASGFVKVVLTNQADPTKTYTIAMSRVDTSPNWATGVRFSGSIDASEKPGGTRDLPIGTYDATFMANDGIQDATPLTGVMITVREANNKPVITDYFVQRLLPSGDTAGDSGKTTDTFVYRAWYKDADNDAPVAYFSGVRQTALTLIVDPGQPTEQRFPMTMVPLTQPAPPAPPATPDYTGADPARWPEWQAKVTGKKLGPGNHSYTVVASDGTDASVFASGVPNVKYGPVLMIPYFKIEPIGKDGEPITSRTVVGKEIVIGGSIDDGGTADPSDDVVYGSRMYFPYIDASSAPSSITNITITITKPDSTTLSLNASMDATKVRHIGNNWVGPLTVYYYSSADPTLVTGNSLTLTDAGQWKINASWPGNETYDATNTDAVIDGHNDEIRIDVSGPSLTVAVQNPLLPDTSPPVANMICPPMLIGASNPGGIFGYDRALPMQIARWVPQSRQYFWYTVGGVFPPLKPGDAVWIKPRVADPAIPGSGYPAAEPLGPVSVAVATPTTNWVVPIGFYASHINGVYDNSSKRGTNYYIHSLATVPFKAGDTQIALTSQLPAGTAQVWVDYVGSQSAVDEGWTTLDNPSVQRAIVGGDPRYMHSKYRLIKVLAKAYPLQVTSTGSPVLDSNTRLPLLQPCTISLGAGWNQIGNIFFNWKKEWGSGTAESSSGSGTLDCVRPVEPQSIAKLLGVYLTPNADIKTATNYYKPGLATTPYRRGDSVVHLTTPLPAGTTTVYLRYEKYPREDVGLPISELKVTYIGVTKTLTEAKAAGWIADYAWRYDPATRNYVLVSPTASGAERVLKAWSGYWIKANVNCQLEIDPNPRAGSDYAGVLSVGSEGSPSATSPEEMEMPPAAPD